jgi:hypothetical protein
LARNQKNVSEWSDMSTVYPRTVRCFNELAI